MANTKIKDAAKVAPEQVEEVMKLEQVEEVRELVAESVIKQKIYVGPNILGLPTYTVIESGFTEHIKGFIEKCPEVRKLFVPISDMANTERRAKEKGTLEHRHYQKVIAFKNVARKGDQ